MVAEELQAAFVARIASLYGKEVRATKKSPGADCMAAAPEPLEGKR